ncbi:MAG: MdlB, multidrug/protein/lipid transporter ATPase, ATP-binding cassette, subfamily bacterial, partial [Candidatus Saccharibacteria bacterium]|nr:MdlB, multidrug/protein/lipid transporter ATPase, ATP-binding cassette, subfamily bacterial [Candidatus Saccharibacteria bacterium]
MSRPKTPSKTIKLYWQALRPYRGWVWMHLVLVAAAVALQSIAVPYLLSEGLGELPGFLAKPGADFWAAFGTIITLYLLAQAGVWLFWRISGIALVKMQIGVVRDLEQSVFNHLTTLSYRFFTGSFSGALVTQANRFVSSFERLYDSLAFDILSLAIRISFSFLIIFMFAPLVAWGLLAFCALYIVSAVILFKKKMPASARSAAAHTKVTARLADNLTNVSAIKYFARERDEIRAYGDITTHHYLAARRDWILQELIHAWQAILMIGFESLVFVFSLKLVADRQIDLGQLVLIQALIWSIFGNLWNVGRVARNIERSLADAAEMTQILMLEPEVKDPPHAPATTITKGH